MKEKTRLSATFKRKLSQHLLGEKTCYSMIKMTEKVERFIYLTFLRDTHRVVDRLVAWRSDESHGGSQEDGKDDRNGVLFSSCLVLYQRWRRTQQV